MIEKINKFLKNYEAPELPFTCSDDFKVESKDRLLHHALIDFVQKETESEYELSGDLGAAMRALKPSDRAFNFSMALLERSHFLQTEKENPMRNFSLYYGFERVAGLIWYLCKPSTVQIGELVKFCNESEEVDIPGSLLMSDYLLELKEEKPLPQDLVQELKTAYDKAVAAGNNQSYHSLSQFAVKMGMVVDLYDPIENIRKKVDTDFCKSSNIERLSDDFPLSELDPYKGAHELVETYVKKGYNSYDSFTAKNSPPEFKQAASESREVQRDYAMAALYRIIWQTSLSDHTYSLYLFFNGLIRKRLPFSEDEMGIVLRAIGSQSVAIWTFGASHFFKNIEAHVKANGLSQKMRDSLLQFMEDSKAIRRDDNFSKVKLRCQEILLQHSGGQIQEVLPFLFATEDNFGVYANKALDDLKESVRQSWYLVLRLAATANGSKPSKTFLKKAVEELERLKPKDFLQTLQYWFGHISKMDLHGERYYEVLLEKSNAQTIKGLLWMLSAMGEESLDPIVEKLVVRSFKKIPGIGPPSASVGNAGIYAAASRNSLSGVAMLNRIRSKVAQRNTKKLIGKYINSTATELAISVEDLEDFSIPDFGLIDGQKEIAFNDYKARISIPQMGKVLTEWVKPDGKLQKTIPSFIRKDFPDELKAMRAEIKLMPKSLSIQRDRLDRGYISKRVLPYEHFEKYYLNHGLMSYLTKRLIWVFENGKESANAIYRDGKWMTIEDKVVVNAGKSTVRLWHPLDSETKEVLAWRDYLEVYQIKQPFKQAYREIYLLTDAEINTKVYSNRMASHILKQHQFNALSSLRSWKYQLLGAYDDGRDGEVCSLEIPDHELRAEFWIDALYAEDAWNDAGIYLYVTTDQVRFTRGRDAISLIDVPKIVFTEAMRDVDLFVGVGSVGNDPQWQDNGGIAQHREYWESYSFGDLTEVAKTRKSILEKLLPRLKIANISEIEGKFLKVKGSKHTYKIHIGSTNILMEPNDQYLCIVPDRSTKSTDKLFIPFEGDRGLSIVLSKAFMLAEDEKITDPTILSQIG